MLRRQIFGKLAGLPLLALGAGRAQAAGKALKIMMKSAWGSDDPTRASFVFAQWSGTGGGRTRGTDLPYRRGDVSDAPGDGGSDHAGGLAFPEGNARKGHSQAHPRLFLRGLLPGPWCHGNRP